MTNLFGSVGSWERGAKNLDADVRTVQKLLAAVSQKLSKAQYHPGPEDGKISRTPGQSNTVKAILAFQKSEVGMAVPDGKIDVNGQTWKKLQALSGGLQPKPPSGAIGLVKITFTHGDLIPKATHFSPAVNATHQGLYESKIVVSGGLQGTFSGSIWPDDMTVKGRVLDGTYPVHIGFHKGGAAAKQGADKLVVETEGIRPGLLVNARNSVPVYSTNPSKKSSVGINIHNGFSSKRFSDGCLTINPSDWSKFIQLFLDAFPNIDDWHSVGTNTGKKIGEVVITKT